MKKNSRLVISLFAFCLVFALGINSVSAASGISIYVNGEKQAYSNQAIMEKGRTLAPLRGIFESLGASVNWNSQSQTVEAYKGSTKIWLKIGSKNAKVNGKTVTLSVPAKLKNGRTLVPLRFISEALGENVQWEGSTQSVYIGNYVIDRLPIPGFENITLGMTKEQVKKIEKSSLLKEERDVLMYTNKWVFDFSANVVYNFKNNKLTEIYIFHDVVNNQYDLQLLESYFIVMYENLSKIYGVPDYLDTDWYDDDDGYELLAYWVTSKNGTLLTSRVNLDFSSYGAIGISIR